jgi:hypothetical protein
MPLHGSTKTLMMAQTTEPESRDLLRNPFDADMIMSSFSHSAMIDGNSV